MSLSTTAPALLGVAGLVALLLGGTLGRRLWRHGLGFALDQVVALLTAQA